VIEQGAGGSVKKRNLKLNAAASLTYKPAKWLTLEGKIAPRFEYNTNHTFVDLIEYHSDPYGTISNATYYPMIRKANEPAGYVPFDATGHVWFLTDNANDLKFNALKKNALNVYPSAAKQYVSGAWKDVEAAVYLAGVWAVMDDTFWLYKDGTEFPARTGDLAYVQIPDTNGGNGTPTVTRNSNNLVITGADKGGARFYAKKFNMTGFSKLCFEGTMATPMYDQMRLKLGVWANTSDNPVASKIGVYSSETTLEISVANLSGEHYVGFWIWHPDSKITVRKLWLE
jgi:hypothetical protein